MSKLNALIHDRNPLVTALQQQGAEVFLVGGAVRDALLEREVTERDWVVVGSTIDKMLALGFRQVGKDFPVFLHPSTQEEYALARTERKIGKGYKGFVCHASPEVTLAQDLLRRDLTINAIALDMTGRLHDPYHGQADLEKRILKHVSEAFREDPLRIFRVARFAARYQTLDFQIDTTTQALMQEMSNAEEISAIAAERVWQETSKALMENAPAIFIDVLHKTRTLQFWCPAWLDQLEQRLTILHQAAQKQLTLEQRIACLCLGMGHPQISSMLTKMRAPSNVQQLARVVSEVWQTLATTPRIDADVLLDLYQRCDLWRRPQQWQAAMPVITLWFSILAPTHWFLHVYVPLDAAALGAVNQVTAAQFLQQGLCGSALGNALREARRDALHGVVENNSASNRD